MERYVGSVFRARLQSMFPCVASDWRVCARPELPTPRCPVDNRAGDPVSLCHRPSGHGLVCTPCTEVRGPAAHRRTHHSWRVWCVSQIQHPAIGYVRDIGSVDRAVEESPQDSLTRLFSPQIVALQSRYIDQIRAACLIHKAPTEVLSLQHTDLWQGQFKVIGDRFYTHIDLGVPPEDLSTSYILASLDHTDTCGSYARRWHLSRFFYNFPTTVSIPASAHAQAQCLRNALVTHLPVEKTIHAV